jgi:hypothetical protein
MIDIDRFVTMDGSSEPLSRAEIEVIVGEYTLSMLDPPNDRHPEFTNLVGFSSNNLEQPQSNEEPMLHATFIKRPKRPRPGPSSSSLLFFPVHSVRISLKNTIGLSAEAREKLGFFSSEMQLVFNNAVVVFDADVWERLYCFFFRFSSSFFTSFHFYGQINICNLFSGKKGRKFERYVGANLESLVEAALEGYFNFRLASTFARVILPPYAGHHGPPHVASQVLRLKMNDVSICSAPSSLPTPEIFCKGIFEAGGSVFPARHEDLSAANAAGSLGPEPFASEKFEVRFF